MCVYVCVCVCVRACVCVCVGGGLTVDQYVGRGGGGREGFSYSSTLFRI